MVVVVVVVESMEELGVMAEQEVFLGESPVVIVVQVEEVVPQVVVLSRFMPKIF